MKARLALVLATLVCAALLWWRLDGDLPARGGRAPVTQRAPDEADTARKTPKPRTPTSPDDRPARAAGEATADNPATRGQPLPPGAGPLQALRGRVEWDDGKPVPGAGVTLASSWFAPEELRTLEGIEGYRTSVTSTADDGRFELSYAPGGTFELHVVAGAQKRSVAEPPAGDRIVIVLARRPATLEVEVLDAVTGDPVPMQEVLLDVSGGTMYAYEFATDVRDNRCTFVSLHVGPAELEIRAEGHEHHRQRVVLEGGKTTRARVALHRGQTVRGRVLDAGTEAPLPGATVSLAGRTIRTETDGDGRFELTHVPWDPGVRRTIVATRAGYAETSASIGDVEDGGVEEIEIRLPRPATVSLRCVDAAGRGVGGVLVLAESFYRASPRSFGLRRGAAASGPGGRVRMEVGPGDLPLEITFWYEGARVLERTAPPLRPSEARDLGDLAVRRAPTLRGTVETAAGEPAAGARVALVPSDPSDTEHDGLATAVIDPRHGARVDAEGRFALRLPPGAYDLLVYGGGHPRLLRLGVAVPASGDPAPLDLRLPEPVALEGRVLDADGAPVPRASIAFQRSHPVAKNLVEEVRADDEGRFAIPGFTRDHPPVTLWVAGPGDGAPAVEVEAVPHAGPVEVRLPAPLR